jgi:hypothetical protein
MRDWLERFIQDSAKESGRPKEELGYVWFQPDRGLGSRFNEVAPWPLQILLFFAAQTDKEEWRDRLAFVVGINRSDLTSKVIEARDKNPQFQSCQHYFNALLEALDYLEHLDHPWELEGQELVANGTTVTLTPQERQFLQILIQHQGEWVLRDEFQQNGINNPEDRKTNLLKKAEKIGVRVEIFSKSGSYRLDR